MLVRMWMSKSPISVTPKTTLTQAAKLMRDKRIRRLPVLSDSKGQQLVGIISKHDILHAYPSNSNPFAAIPSTDVVSRHVESHMSRAVISVTPNTPLEEAAEKLLIHRIGAVPVLLNRQLVGIITESDIFRAFGMLMGVNSNALRITLDLSTEPYAMQRVLEMTNPEYLLLMSIFYYREDSKSVGVLRWRGPHPEDFIDELYESGLKIVSIHQGLTPLKRKRMRMKKKQR